MMTPAILFITVFAILFGLAIGSFLNVVAYRVPAGIPLTRESRCPQCDTGIRWWQNVPVVSWIALRGRCANCGQRISPRYPIVEAVTAVFFALVALGLMLPHPTPGMLTDAGFWGILITLAVFAGLSVALTLIDLDVKRLPDAIVLPGWGAIVVLLLVTTLLGGASTGSATQVTGSAAQGLGSAAQAIDWWPFLRALIGGAALFLFYYLIRLISPRGMGGGDVKLAGLVGTVLGWFGWGALAFGAFAAFLLGGIFGGILLLTGRAKRRSAIPFGPWIIAGAWVGIVVGEPVGRWYLGLMS